MAGLAAKRRRSEVLRPISNSLVGLFNAIKQQNMSNHLVLSALDSPQNPHSDVWTLKWEQYQLMQKIINGTVAIQESVVGLLVSLNPEDPEGRKAFEAGRYGLSSEDLEMQREFKRNQLRNLREQSTPAPAAAAVPAEPDENT